MNLKQIEEQQTKSKDSRQSEIIKIRDEINEFKTRKIIQRIN
jgi:hypothetical protein